MSRGAIAILGWLGFYAPLVGGCVTSKHFPVKAPDGRQAMLVTCPRGHEDCGEEALEGCPFGHDVIEESLPEYAGIRASEDRLVMLVRCRRRGE